jgi:hypothetical protein
MKNLRKHVLKTPAKIAAVFNIFVFLLCVTGCDFYTASGMEGNLTVNFGSEGTGQSVNRSMSKPPQDIQSALDYTLTFTGPDDQSFIRNVSAGTPSIHLTLALGDWHVAAEARMPGNIFVGFGEKRFTMRPGNNQVMIPMTASGTFYEIHIDPAITGGTVSASFSAVFAGTTVTLMAAPDNTAWYTISAGDFVITGSPTVSGSGGVFTFTMPEADISISADFTDKYALGDTGPAGGKIFYVNPSPTDWKYMECTATPIPGSPTHAGDSASEIPGTNSGSPDFGENIGKGKDNTRMILEFYTGINYSTTGLAAQLCDDYSVTAGDILFGDWFLPSQQELVEMYNNSGLTFGSPGWTWSSTKDSIGYTKFVVMSSGTPAQNWDGPGNNNDVYAVRCF